MVFKRLLIEKYNNKNIDIFVDMDGVIAEYDMIKPYEFLNRRPIFTNIKTLEDISLMKNVKLHILSICKEDYQIKEKQKWLDEYAPYFKEDNRVIISKESNPNKTSKELKYNYLKNIKNNKNNVYIFIDDDNDIVHYIRKNIDWIVVYQDSSIID